MIVEDKNKWPKTITVDKRIVRILSSSTYSNFPSAIKEIIVNGYDADADRVDLKFDLSNSVISIFDNGKGMNENDFSFYLRIAGKSRKKNETITKNGRKIVGQFGVGFLSALPFCERYLIETTKKGSAEVLSATITSLEYFNDDYSAIDVDKIPITGGVRLDNSKIEESYTRIRLVGFSKLTRSYFNREYTVDGKRNTIRNFEPLDLLKWELQEYLPIEYDTNDRTGEILNQLSKDYSDKRFEVYFNDRKLYRNIHARKILDYSAESIEIGDIKFKYFISTNYSPITPVEARHLLIRNLNVGVGDRTSFGIGMDGRVYGKLAHLTGEILVEEGLNDLISVSRDKFNYSSEYEQLKEFFREKIRIYANELDAIKGVENFLENFQDETKVSDINNLREDYLSKRIEKLENSGFEIVKHSEDVGSVKNQIEEKSIELISPVRLDKFEKKIHLQIKEDEIRKSIIVAENKYILKLEKWDLNSMYPAIQLDGQMVKINENYPLFSNKKQVDLFLKLHILLMDNLIKGNLSQSGYSSILNDILTTFK